jgi:hypothetical protein
MMNSLPIKYVMEVEKIPIALILSTLTLQFGTTRTISTTLLVIVAKGLVFLSLSL